VDALLMTDLLEHVRQPRQILNEAHRILSNPGYLLVRVPDVNGLLIKALDLGYQLSGKRFTKAGRTLYSVHLYGFSGSTLARYFNESGFRILTHYGESSKNLSALGEKRWASNPLIRAGIIGLTRLGELLNRQDEIVVIAQKMPSNQPYQGS
jgi:hypothetical protein